jgi:hypothetical protein
MRIDFTKENVEYLDLLLQRELKTVLMEQHHTALKDYKQMLRERIAEIEDMISKLENAN